MAGVLSHRRERSQRGKSSPLYSPTAPRIGPDSRLTRAAKRYLFDHCVGIVALSETDAQITLLPRRDFQMATVSPGASHLHIDNLTEIENNRRLRPEIEQLDLRAVETNRMKAQKHRGRHEPERNRTANGEQPQQTA